MSRSRIAFVLSVLALGAACERSPWPPPPETRVAVVVDTFHGVALSDPYRWLEDQDAPEVREWLARQAEYADTILHDSPLRQRFLTRLTELMDRPGGGGTRRAGDWEYFTLRRAGDEVSAIYRRPRPEEPTLIDPDGEYEKILDPIEEDPSGTTTYSITDISSDGRRMLYSVRSGGPDEIEVRLYDLENRRDLDDRLPRALYGSVSFENDDRAIRYVARSRETGPRLKEHRIGTDLESDSVLWGDGIAPTSFLSARDGMNGRYRLYTVQHGWASNDMYLQDLRRGGDAIAIAKDLSAQFSPRFVDGRLLVLTNLDAPKNRIVEIDPASPGAPESWKTVLPEGEFVIDDFTKIGDAWYVTIIDDVSNRVLIYDENFQQTGELDVPPHSNVNVGSAGEGKASLSVSSFLQPSVEYRIDLKTGERTVWDQDEDLAFDPSGFVLEQVWYTSKDGTRAPMYVMYREGTARDGTNPTLLTGYGGFDLSLMPGFNASAIAWLEEGGVYAVATLRGGGEFGEDWHRDGMLENKQHVFDDFISAGEWLVESGFTSPEHLAIRGGSNGGLLMGAAITQRPDLFAAAWVGVPDLDMVRFSRYSHNNNAPALLEYGDASVREQFDFVRAYSPYENVHDGTAYPAIMLETGDLDTRVPPLQARKMTAKLQAATSSGKPVVLHYDERRGHAGGRSRTHSIEDTATQLAFLMEHAGYPDGRAAAATAESAQH